MPRSQPEKVVSKNESKPAAATAELKSIIAKCGKLADLKVSH